MKRLAGLTVKSLALLTVIGLLFVAVGGGTANAKYASVVMDAETGRVLHARNANTRNYPASLTKMMTLYMVFEALERGELSLDTRLEVSRRAEGQAPSKLGLKRGQTIRVEDAILALVTKSANDVATVVAEGLAESEYKFALAMTKRARALGMRRTTFRNASGLPNRRQLSTARDMALLARRMMEDFPQYYPYFSRERFTWNGRTYGNHNNLLGHYEGTDGIKTGYTRASGFNLVASVERNGRRLIGVVFGGRSSKTRDRHMVKLLDKGFVRVAQIPSQEELLEVAARAARTAERIDARNPFRNKVAAEVPANENGVVAQGDADPAAVASAKAAAAETAIRRRTGPWKIQVGAFHDAEPARKIARTAHSKLRDLGDGLSITVDLRADGRIYRARLAGIESEKDARMACRVLRRRNLDCLPIAPSNNRRVASN